jgi:Amt family ammonium transporter
MQILRSALQYLSAGAFFLAASTAQVIASESGVDSGDTAWILSATALVLFMALPGLALFYAGLV